MELAHIANDISVFVGTLAKFLAILKMVHIANAVSVFVGTLAKFLASLKMVHIANAVVVFVDPGQVSCHFDDGPHS